MDIVDGELAVSYIAIESIKESLPITATDVRKRWDEYFENLRGKQESIFDALSDEIIEKIKQYDHVGDGK